MLDQLRTFSVPVLRRRAGILSAAVIGGICLSLYLSTIAPSALGGDAGELQFVPYILSLTHPTGYPLHTLLGKLWATVVPIGSVAYRMNLFSSVAGALAVALIYDAIWNLTNSRLSAAVAAISFGVSSIFWDQAIQGDKYALNVCLLALVLMTLVRWDKARDSRWLTRCAVCCGMSLAHHRSMLIVVPLVVMYGVWQEPRLRREWRFAVRTLLLILAPFLLYVWLPIGASRGLPPGTWHPASLSGWVGYMLDRGYLNALQPQVAIGPKLIVYARTLLAQFTLCGIALGLAGLWRQWRRRKALGLFFLVSFFLEAVLSAAYEVPRHWVFFLPSFVIFTLWIGEGLAWILAAGAAWIAARRPMGYGAAGIALASSVALVALPLWTNYPEFRAKHLDGGSLDPWRQELKSGYLAERFAVNSLSMVEPDSVIVADWEQATPLWYYQQVEGWRPDVMVMYPIERWEEALGTGRPTYLARTLAGVGESHRLTGAGPLVKVSKVPEMQIPSNLTLAAVNLGGELEFIGYRTYRADFSAGYVWPVSLCFRALKPLDADYALSVRLFSEGGTQVWSEDRQHLVLGMYPTTRWVAGEVVSEYVEVPFPRNLPAGRYQIGLLAYTSTGDGDWKNLTVAGSEAQVVYLPPIEAPARR